MTGENVEYRYLSNPPNLALIQNRLNQALELADRHHRGKIAIIGAERLEVSTNQVQVLLCTIDLADPGQLQFARNVRDVLERCSSDTKVKGRLPVFLEWLGGLG